MYSDPWSDGGTNWTEDTSETWQVSATAVAEADGRLYVANGYDLLRSPDGRSSLARINVGIGNVQTVALTAFGKYLFAGHENGSINRSDDQGDHWTDLNKSLPFERVHRFRVRGDTLYAVSHGDGIFRSVDAPSNRGLAYASGSLPRIRALETRGSHVFVSTDTGVYHSANQGGDWSRIDQGMNDSGFICLAMDGNYLYAGTSSVAVSTSEFNRGAVWRRPLADLEVSPVAEPGSGKRTVPLANGTGARVLVAPGIVELSLDRSAVIELSLWDIAGKKSASLLHGPFPPGRYRAVLPGAAAEGLRILRLKLEGSESRSMLLRP